MTNDPIPVVSIIVPARNEEACLAACLQSLIAQTGIDYEIIVVDDDSVDRTAEIARRFVTMTGNHTASSLPDTLSDTTIGSADRLAAGAHVCPVVTIIAAPPVPANWTGKNNATSAGAKIAKGKWLLFTDADTVHKPGSLARAVAEAEEHGAALLSYSPEQEVDTFWEKAVMPVIFAELATTFPPQAVNDPASPIAAANGQYLMISREAYDAVGGHAAVANDLLEDVAMARLVKSSRRKIFFRYGGDAVRTRMYRNFTQMKEGWTKNLALLFPRPVTLASLRLAEFMLILANVVIAALASLSERWNLALQAALLTVILAGWFWLRIRKAHFPPASNVFAVLGLPLFSFLLFRSVRSHQSKTVIWKGREYACSSAKTTPNERAHISSAGAEFR
jgi:glycosyltransferase involved in cell wall biosynthesis